MTINNIAIPLVQTTDRNINQLQQNIVQAIRKLHNQIGTSGTGSYFITVGESGNYQSLQQAINSLTNGGMIVVLSDYNDAENIVLSASNNNITIEGVDNAATIRGTLDLYSSNCGISNIRITGNVTFQAASKYNIFTNFWVPATCVVTDNGSSNLILGIREA